MGELNKVAANVALGRNCAGVHYRSDSELGMLLEETMGISLLPERRYSHSESFSGFTFTKFDGTKVTI